VNDWQLAQYIAASGPLHCADGWSILGRAIDSHARGDVDCARHLAYYAELRAALSLLATEGIGIFGNRHFVVDGTKKCHRIGKKSGTHLVAWHALRRWADLERSAELLGQGLIVNGLRLHEWIDEFMGGPSLQPVGSRWLQIWGMDLQRFSSDHDARNESSYRPTRLRRRTATNVSDSTEFISSLWTLCEPSANSRFESLDRYLLRLTLEDTFFGLTNKKADDDPARFKENVSAMLSSIIMAGSASSDWEKFLTRKIDSSDPVAIEEAKKNDPVDHPRHDLQVMSRAALLLRVATAACSVLFKETGVSKGDVKFWWSDFGRDRGIWDTTNEPDEFTDMWADVDGAMASVKDWKDNTSAADQSFSRLQRERSYPMSVLGGCERIALWGFGL
jgi:hypothetical protein